MTGTPFEFSNNGAAPPGDDGRLDAPSFHRNAEPIWSAFADYFTGSGAVLEIGSGTGQHITAYAARCPQLTFWPADMMASHRASIEAYRRAAQLPNLRPPQSIDLMNATWDWQGDGELRALLCINVIHVAPWAVAQNLMTGAGRHIAVGGHLLMYGPYKKDGAHTAPSNEAFDASLRQRNPEWGVRDIEAVTGLAAQNNLTLIKTVAMPANNLALAFERR